MTSITIERKTTAREVFNIENLKVVVANSRDIDSNNLEVFYNEIQIGSGHLNNRTNMAHIYLNADNPVLEYYLTDGIEKRSITLH